MSAAARIRSVAGRVGAGVLAVWLGAGAVRAECALEPGPALRVAKVLDAETAALDDGREVRLINVVSPRRPLWLAPERKWPAAERAERALDGLIAGKEVRIAPDGPGTDRHGRMLGHLHVARAGVPVWVQGALVAQGHARVQSTPETRTCVKALLELEARARDGARGLWRSAFYRVRQAEVPGEIVKLKNTFALIEGKVLKHARVGPRTFLNFEDDWRRDFTVMVSNGREDCSKNRKSPLKSFRERAYVFEDGSAIITGR